MTAAFFLLATASSWAAHAAADGSASTVFRIGTFDRSSLEFAQVTPAHTATFIVGQSDVAKDWYANQPAVPVEGAGNASAPWTITFSLAQAPAGAYALHVALLVETPGVPALRVGINGKEGRFYLKPEIDYAAGDLPGIFNAAYSHADVIVPFPAGYLHQGSNTITLQSVEEGDKPSADAALTYDAIELQKTAERFDPDATSAKAEPTIFYRRQGDAALEEVVDVLVDYRQPVQAGDAVGLTIGGKSYRQTLKGGQDFGEEKLEYSVAEFAPKAKAEINWNAGGHRQRAEQFVDPKKKWTLILVPHIHLDVGYSDYQAKIAAIQSRVLDEAMDFTDQHPDFRFSTDGMWNLEQFMQSRTPAEQKRMTVAIQNQKIYLPAQYANLLTGFPTAETLIRSLYGSANFSRVYGSPFDYANITDVPTYSWSYASILASAGIHSFLAGSDNYRAPVLLQGHLNENSPMWWQGPDGQKVLFLYSRHYEQMQFVFGLPPSLSAGAEMLPLFLRQFEHPSYRANAAIIFGTQVENTDLFPQQAELAGQWNKVYAYPQMQYSGFQEALKTVAGQFGNDIPTIRGDGGPYWEDGIASDAYYAAIERQNESRGPSAEKLEMLTALTNPRLAPDKASLDRMWTDMLLMDEHTFTSYNSITDPTARMVHEQLAVKNLYATNAQALADWMTRNSMATIADSISVGSGGVLVFNTLNWSRSGIVTFDLQKEDEIVDSSTGQAVPLEEVSQGNAFRRVRFMASDVPPVGYKVFLLRPAEKPPAPAATSRSATLESQYYRVQLDPSTGAIRSIFDKQLQHELVNQQSPYRFGQYLYVTGADKLPNSLVQYRAISPRPDLQIHTAQGGSLISVAQTPYGWVAKMKSTATNTPEIATEIRLFNNQKKLEFIEDVTKTEVTTKEGVYFAFPFAMEHPRFQYEIQSAVVNPAVDTYTGAGRVWFSAQHWVSVDQDGISGTVMPLDASLVTLGDISRGDWPRTFENRPGTIFSYIMNNYWDTNYAPGQGGHFQFRYVITSASATDPAALSRMGWEEMTPLEKNEVTKQDKAVNAPRALDGKQGSFLQVDDPNVLLEAWKVAEDGNGMILRFLDLGGTERTVTVGMPYFTPRQAWRTDAVERNLAPIDLTAGKGLQVSIHPHEIVTVRVTGTSTLQAH